MDTRHHQMVGKDRIQSVLVNLKKKKKKSGCHPRLCPQDASDGTWHLCAWDACRLFYVGCVLRLWAGGSGLCPEHTDSASPERVSRPEML